MWADDDHRRLILVGVLHIFIMGDDLVVVVVGHGKITQTVKARNAKRKKRARIQLSVCFSLPHFDFNNPPLYEALSTRKGQLLSLLLLLVVDLETVANELY